MGEVVFERESADIEKRGGVFAGVDQVRKPVRGITVTAQTLKETDVRGQTQEKQCDHVEWNGQVTIAFRSTWRVRVNV